ncbi:MAG: DegT/DnrJ/EryC1/StrS family aminotransferase [Anaerolineae bacterium]|nr:DegT/DnrJ/EryC1/StrS family aminotransferase [Thermoflexus sp.]MDW8064573.1 DegT/DnrJ/EryC1/StrS family aminotransferase [Anaerolineae bacterium]
MRFPFPRRDRYLVFGAPRLPEEAIEAAVRVLRSGWLGTGPQVAAFEKAFAEYIGTPFAVAVGSCTAALHLALRLVGVGPGDEVITTPITFAATANVIVHAGARPVFADVDLRTGNLDPEAAQSAITSRTKAILVVHYGGRPCEMDAFLALARRYDLFLIEDAAHALEAFYRGRKVGTLGDLAAFSFYPTKSLTTGEGGMLTTSVEAWAERARILRLHGLSRDAWRRYSEDAFPDYEVLEPGYKYNMTDIQAALGLAQLPYLERWLRCREYYWSLYNQGLQDLAGISLPPEDTHLVHARHLYTIRVNPREAPFDRDTLIHLLHKAGIGTGIHYKALHLHRFYREAFGYRPGMFPSAERISEETLSLPLSAHMEESDILYVIDVIRFLWREGRF